MHHKAEETKRTNNKWVEFTVSAQLDMKLLSSADESKSSLDLCKYIQDTISQSQIMWSKRFVVIMLPFLLSAQPMIYVHYL